MGCFIHLFSHRSFFSTVLHAMSRSNLFKRLSDVASLQLPYIETRNDVLECGARLTGGIKRQRANALAWSVGSSSQRRLYQSVAHALHFNLVAGSRRRASGRLSMRWPREQDGNGSPFGARHAGNGLSPRITREHNNSSPHLADGQPSGGPCCRPRR